MVESEQLKELTSFIIQKGFVWGPSPEIYGGMAGFYTYGPLGKLLKNNVEEAIRKTFQRHEFFEIECPTVMPKEVWEASGHLKEFRDPLIQCSKCISNFRVDNLIEEHFPDVNTSHMDEKQLLDFILERNMRCPNCKSHLVPEIKSHSLMMKTIIGVDTEAYNRPETATTSYLPFMRCVDFFRDKLPFGVFQIGKAYRNEISPRQHMLRMREFTQAEGQIFLFDTQKNEFENFEQNKNKKLPLWSSEMQKKNKKSQMVSLAVAFKNKLLKNKAYIWTLLLTYELFLEMGLPAERIRFRQHHETEKAFYVEDAWDLEVNLNSFGWTEMCGVHDRTDYDLKQHAAKSKKELFARDEKNVKKTPHVLEIAFGTDRPTFALLDIFYEKKQAAEGKTKFKIPPKLAPINLGVFPLVNKDKIPELAKKIYNSLIDDFVCVYDKSGAVGRRYLRQDENGTPFCATVDYDSLKDNSVTIRFRDTEQQIRVKIDEIANVINRALKGEEFGKLGKLVK